jgi:hypothetical protein
VAEPIDDDPNARARSASKSVLWQRLLNVTEEALAELPARNLDERAAAGEQVVAFALIVGERCGSGKGFGGLGAASDGGPPV